jgi:hypothetical protein
MLAAVINYLCFKHEPNTRKQIYYLQIILISTNEIWVKFGYKKAHFFPTQNGLKLRKLVFDKVTSKNFLIKIASLSGWNCIIKILPLFLNLV